MVERKHFIHYECDSKGVVELTTGYRTNIIILITQNTLTLYDVIINLIYFLFEICSKTCFDFFSKLKLYKK